MKLNAIEITKKILLENPQYRYMKPSVFMEKTFKYYRNNFESNNSLNGAVYEYLVITCLLNAGIEPIYYQAKMSYVPNVIFDVMIYNRKTPVSISLKTSIRERWKQADLEAVALKYIFRQAKCYLVSNDNTEINRRRSDAHSYMGLDEFICSTGDSFDLFVEELLKIKAEENESIPVFSSSIEYTSNNFFVDVSSDEVALDE
jgi:hypothetical protein